MPRIAKPVARSQALQYVGMRVPKALLKIIDEAASLQSRTRSNFMVLASAKAARAMIDSNEPLS